MARSPRRCQVCGRYVGATRKHRHRPPQGAPQRERTAARLVKEGLPASQARRRAGLAPLPRYLTYRPRGRLARHLTAAQARRTRNTLGRFIPRRPRRS